MAEETIMKHSNPNTIEHWKRLSERYRKQRDRAVREIQCLQKELYIATGEAKDGNDYLRQIKATKVRSPVYVRVLNLFRGTL
jgi:hypothetical protein